MTPNQHLVPMRPTREAWKPFTMSRVIDDLFDGLSAIDNQFCDSWNFPTPAPLPLPENVIFNDPATIVYWDDGTKTVVKCQPGDVFSAETGLTTAMLKKYMGNDNTFNRVINEWLKRTGQHHPALPVLPTPDCVETPAAEATE